MSREIKFRAWHDGEKYPEDACMLFVGDDKGTRHPLDCCKYLMEGQPVKLMQYTGLKDKNGVEIYEGDIQKVTNGKHYWLYVVKSVGGQFGNSLYSCMFEHNASIDEDTNAYTYTPERVSEKIDIVKSGKDCEVIGNIYENKNLLEK